MKQPGLFLMAVLLAAGALLAACSTQPTLTPTPAFDIQPPGVKATPGEAIRAKAQIDDIEILILESFPVQVNVMVHGNLPNGCATIDDIVQERIGQEFRVTITTVQPADVMCAEVLVPFEETISLDVVGLKAGTYTVNVNGVIRSFDLAMDNVLPTESARPAELSSQSLYNTVR
jgi:inhibitor of cysteine peptidase